MSGQVSIDTHAGQDALTRPDPIVRRITIEDMTDAFAQGLRDFQKAPRFGLTFGALFALGGLAIAACAYWFGVSYLIYPFIVGFAMIGPIAAIGIYEVARMEEQGVAPTWRRVISTMIAQCGAELGWMAFVTLFIFVAWVYAAQILVALFFGLHSFSSQANFLATIVTTPEGFLFLLIGNLIGLALLFVTFALTVVSVPLLLERDVDFVTAMITSLRAVGASPGPMIGWAALVLILLVVGSVPAFLGLIVTVPLLAHATWRLYRKIVVPPAV